MLISGGFAAAATVALLHVFLWKSYLLSPALRTWKLAIFFIFTATVVQDILFTHHATFSYLRSSYLATSKSNILLLIILASLCSILVLRMYPRLADALVLLGGANITAERDSRRPGLLLLLSVLVFSKVKEERPASQLDSAHC